MRKLRIASCALALAAACGSPRGDASGDSALALQPPDTVKALPDTVDATQASRNAVRQAPQARTETVPAVRADTTAQPQTARRDSAIKFDVRNPRRRVPSIPDTARDTTKSLR